MKTKACNDIRDRYQLSTVIEPDQWFREKAETDIYQALNRNDVKRFIETYNHRFCKNASTKRNKALRDIAPYLASAFERKVNLKFSWVGHGHSARAILKMLQKHDLILYKPGNNITHEISKIRVSRELYKMIKPTATISTKTKQKNDPEAKIKKSFKQPKSEEALIDEYNDFMCKQNIVYNNGSIQYLLRRTYKKLSDEKIFAGRLSQIVNDDEQCISSLPSKERAKIQINTEPVASLDITASQPQIAYCLKTKRSLDYDPYLSEADQMLRELSKTALLVIMNTDSVRIAQSAFNAELNGVNSHSEPNSSKIINLKKYNEMMPYRDYMKANHIKFKDIYSNLVSRNPDVIHDKKPSCYELMKIESDIALHLMNKLAKIDVPSVQIADEFIVPQSKIEILKVLFVDTFRERLHGCDPMYKIDDVRYLGMNVFEELDNLVA